MKRIALILFIFLLTLSLFAAEVTSYVDPDAVGGGTGVDWTNAYTSLNAWEAAEQTDLVTDTDWHHVYVRASSGTADTTAVIINGWTTGATNYILIEAASGDRATADGWKTDRYRLSINDGAALSISAVNYVRVDGLQIEVYDCSATRQCIREYSISAGGCYYRYSNLRLRADSNVGIISTIWDSSDGDAHTIDAYNIIMYARSDNAGDVDGAYIGSAGTAGDINLYNITCYNTRRGIRDGNESKVDLYNSAIFNNADDFVGVFNVLDHCASDDGGGTNEVAESGGGAAWPDDFEGAGTGDFRLKSGSNLVGASSDLSGGLFTDDIEGTVRGAAWDIGAFEYVAAVGDIVIFRRRLLGYIFFTAGLNIALFIMLLYVYKKLNYYKKKLIFFNDPDNINALSDLNKYLENSL